MRTHSDFLNFIYKDGKVPIDDIESGKYQEIRAIVGRLCNTLNGSTDSAKSKMPRLKYTKLGADESEWINKRIVELHDGPAHMSFKEISQELGVGLSRDAVQKRYINYMDRQRNTTNTEGIAALRGAAEVIEVTYPEVNPEVAQEPIAEKIEQVPGLPALQDAEPEHSENATIRENQIVEKAEEVTAEDLQAPAPGQLSEDDIVAEIMRLADIKKDMKWIAEELEKKGVSLSYGQVRARYAHEKFMQKRAAAKGEPSTKLGTVSAEELDKMLESPDGAIQNPACRPEENLTESSLEDQEPRATSRANLEGMIYDMYTKEHLTPAEISNRLYAQRLFYSEKTVVVRLRKLGVDI